MLLTDKGPDRSKYSQRRKIAAITSPADIKLIYHKSTEYSDK